MVIPFLGIYHTGKYREFQCPKQWLINVKCNQNIKHIHTYI